LPLDVFGPGIIKDFPKYGINVLFASGFIMSVLKDVPFRLDLSSIEHVFLGGTYTSASTKKQCNKLLKKFGSNARVVIGYGLSEAGAACIISSPDRDDDAMGYPLPGVKVKIYDEDEQKYYDIEDGPRTGVLFISSASVSCGRLGDKVFFELDDIDGEKYLNTYDCVRVNEDGSLTYAGRMNRYFVNNEGVRFDSGLVETSVAAEPGIEECALAPEFSKWIHDTVPVLYVKTAERGRAAENTARIVLKKVFIEDGKIKDTNLPAQLVLAKDLPHNKSGKVDVNSIRDGVVNGRRFAVHPVRTNGKLRDVELIRINDSEAQLIAGVPEEVEDMLPRMAPTEEKIDGPGGAPDDVLCTILKEIF
jgi:acyl-coenzyme A synthetase/AMP-(fatty) acid ligase